MKTGPSSGSSGFTVIEVLIALAIISLLATVGVSRYLDYRERARVYAAVGDIGAMSATITQYALDNRDPPDTLAQVGLANRLDPWGRPYEYYNLTSHMGNGGARKDRRLNPLNTDFDLYSVGRDGGSSSSLQARASRDDVVRARDGRFIGLASDFDP